MTKTVCITGASGGMGQATVQELMCCGWNVIGIDRNQRRLSEMVRDLDDNRFIPLDIDLTSPRLESELVTLFEKNPTLDGLVNLAGISIGDEIDQLSDDEWDLSFAVNVSAPMRLIRTAVPFLRASGGGSVVNVSSPVGFVGARKVAYAASKAAMHGLTMSLARGLGNDNIRVNTLIPGTAITFMTNDWPQEKRAAIADELLLKRLCQPSEIGKVIRFLLSDDSSYMTGSIVDMSCGGMIGH